MRIQKFYLRDGNPDALPIKELRRTPGYIHALGVQFTQVRCPLFHNNGRFILLDVDAQFLVDFVGIYP